MSADFMTFIAAVDHETGTKLFRKLLPRQQLGALIGPAGDTLFAFHTGEELDVQALKEQYAGDLPAAAYFENAFVNTDPTPLLETLEQDGTSLEVVLSSPFTALAILDRVLAVPRGVELLNGQAAGLFHEEKLKQTWIAWCDLMRDIGGAEAAARVLARYLHPQLVRFGDGMSGPALRNAEREGVADATRLLDAFAAQFERAQRDRLDVLLFATTT